MPRIGLAFYYLLKDAYQKICARDAGRAERCWAVHPFISATPYVAVDYHGRSPDK